MGRCRDCTYLNLSSVVYDSGHSHYHNVCNKYLRAHRNVTSSTLDTDAIYQIVGNDTSWVCINFNSNSCRYELIKHNPMV